jgi:hypothetical protein
MLVYVAAPYSSIPDKNELMRIISKFCGEYMIANPGEYAIPGLVHHYPTLECPELGTDYSFWQNFCEVFLSRCDKMIVLRIPGWQESKGVKGELEFCLTHRIPVEFRDI